MPISGRKVPICAAKDLTSGVRRGGLTLAKLGPGGVLWLAERTRAPKAIADSLADDEGGRVDMADLPEILTFCTPNDRYQNQFIQLCSDRR